jgi:hypothetical protein
MASLIKTANLQLANTTRYAQTSSSRYRAPTGMAFARCPATMRGTKVTATMTYCGHILRVEVELNRQRDWIGRCVVTGPAFNGAVRLYAPFPTPREPLEAILTLARHSVDAERAAKSPRSSDVEVGNARVTGRRKRISSCNSERGQ